MRLIDYIPHSLRPLPSHSVLSTGWCMGHWDVCARATKPHYVVVYKAYPSFLFLQGGKVFVVISSSSQTTPNSNNCIVDFVSVHPFLFSPPFFPFFHWLFLPKFFVNLKNMFFLFFNVTYCHKLPTSFTPTCYSSVYLRVLFVLQVARHESQPLSPHLAVVTCVHTCFTQFLCTTPSDTQHIFNRNMFRCCF